MITACRGAISGLLVAAAARELSAQIRDAFKFFGAPSMRINYVRLAASILLVSTFWVSQAAQAQVSPQAYASAPADHLMITPSGIDLRTGQYQYKHTDLSVGGEGAAGLQLTRLPRRDILTDVLASLEPYVEPFASFTHNFDIMIAETRVHIHNNNFNHGSGSDYRMFVHFGRPPDTFDGRGPTPFFEQVSKQAATRLTYSGTASASSVIYTYQTADGTLATFRPLGSSDCASVYRCAYVSEIHYPDGTRLSFEYASPTPSVANTTRLRSVTSNRGYALLLEYGAGSLAKMVSRACVINLSETAKPANNVCPAGAATSNYTYGSTNTGPVLASSTDAGGATSGYQYGTNTMGQATIGFVRPGEQTPWMTLDGHRQVFADGQTYEIHLQNSAAETEGTIHSGGGGTVIDSQGKQIEVRYGYPLYPRVFLPGYDPNAPYNYPNEGSPNVYQVTPGPISITDQLGRTTTYEYCDPVIAASSPGDCVVIPLRHYTDPEGIVTEVNYDAWRNVSGIRRKAKPGSGLPDIVLTAIHDCVNRPKSCAKPSSVTDGRGNTTEYTYSPDHGGVLTETKPAVNGVRPQVRYEYGQQYAWLKNAAGGYSQASSPVWLLVKESLCRTSAATGNPGAPCASAGDEVVTTYDYGPNSGPNNLLLRGKVVTADGVSRRTCYGYDSRGNIISQATPRAGLTSCP